MSALANPFPGMNPFLQKYWSDVHTSLIGFIREALGEEMPADLTARAEEHVVIAGHTTAEAPQSYRADVAILEKWKDGFPPLWSAEGQGGAAAVAEPLVFVEVPPLHRWVEIRDPAGTLITIIEVISPANKRGAGWREYRERQRELIYAGVNLVEIDLIRGGNHVVALDPDRLQWPEGTAHIVCVTRGRTSDALRHEVYLCPLRDTLPAIRVPLRVTDPDVPLALQPLVDRCYRTGRYWLLDHKTDPEPPVAAVDLPWLDERVRAAGLR